MLSWYLGHSDSAQKVSAIQSVLSSAGIHAIQAVFSCIQAIQAVLFWYPPLRQCSDGIRYSGSAQMVSGIQAVLRWYPPFRQCSSSIHIIRHCSAGILISGPSTYCSDHCGCSCWYTGRSGSDQQVSRPFSRDQLVFRPFRQCSADVQIIQAVLSWYPGHSGSAQLVSRSFRQCSAGIQGTKAVISR
jgi:hypothetical protein